MDTKSLIISKATILFQKKGYKGVGLSEILKECKITKGALYHHFPSGKEELLTACLHSLNEGIIRDIEDIFRLHPNTQEAFNAMIGKLVSQFEEEGTITGYTFSSIVSDMDALSDPVQNACAKLYQDIQDIYFRKLKAEGLPEAKAHSFALIMTATIEGGMLLCLTQKSAEPLKVIMDTLPHMIADNGK